MDDLKDWEFTKELLERLVALESKLDSFTETNTLILKEIKETLKRLNDISHKHETRISTLEAEIKWFAKIPILILLGLNIFLNILNFLKQMP